MAKDLTIKSPDGQTVLYPKTVQNLVYNNVTGRPLSEDSKDICFDISEFKKSGATPATYASLSAALGTNGANVPEGIRKGGMSVKYIDSTTEQYVQFRLMKKTWSTTVSDWQGVDDEPTAGSNNLVKSSGVSHFLLNGFLKGNNNTIARNTLYGLKPGFTYRLYLKNVPWDVSNVTATNVNCLSVSYYSTTSQQTETLFSVPIENIANVKELYTFTVPEDAEYIIIAGRANAGVNVYFDVELQENSFSANILTTSPISIDYANNTFTIVIPEGTIVTYPEGAYYMATGESVTLTYTNPYVQNISKVIFNASTNTFSAVVINYVCKKDEYEVFLFSTRGDCSLPEKMYTFNGAVSASEKINNLYEYDGLIQKVDTTFTTGHYVNKSGVLTASNNFGMSEVISLAKEQTLIVEWATEGTLISVIAGVTVNGSVTTYTPLVIAGTNAEDTLTKRRFSYYIATEAIDVVVSTRRPTATYLYLLKEGYFCRHILKSIDTNKAEIDVLKESIYTLPENFANRVEEVNTLKGTKFCFLIQTDTHFIITDESTQSFNKGRDAKELTKYIGFDFAANLGDIVQGYSDMTKELYRQSMTEIMKRYLDGICCPFMYAKGNHECNGMYANTLQDPADGYIYDDEIYGRTTQPAKSSTRYGWVGNGRSQYGYMDFDDADIRVIVLNTSSVPTPGYPNVGTFGIDDNQLSWFINVALNTTKKVIVLSHVPLIDDIASDGETHNNNASIRQVLTPLSNFKNNGGTVIGCFCGHLHEDVANTRDGINHICFRAAHLCSAVLVDTSNKVITIKTFGYDNDRTFSYT